MIDLSTCTTVKSADLKSHKRNSFEISTAETTYLIYADTEKEKDDWIGSVGRAIVRCSSTYQRENTAASQSYDGQGQQDDDDGGSVYSNDSNNPYFNQLKEDPWKGLSFFMLRIWRAKKSRVEMDQPRPGCFLPVVEVGLHVAMIQCTGHACLGKGAGAETLLL